MKYFALVILLAASAWAIDPPKPATINFTPELQTKLQANLIRQYQIELNIRNLDDNYHQLSQRLQNDRASAQAEGQKLQTETLKQLGLDPKLKTLQLNASGELEVVDVKAAAGEKKP